MAKAPAKKKDDGEPKKPSAIIGIIGLLVATLLAAGAGAFFGLKMLAPGTGLAATEAGHGAGSDKKEPPVETWKVRPLPPVITNLAMPRNTWVRLETMMVLDNEDPKDLNLLTAKISEDMVSYLRTLTLSQLEGPSALQHLKEDLNDRARLRSEGKVREIIVHGLVAE
ncbi:MAG: flagellar basal body-associated FliL family protein [Hyphomicrobiaceae bacterium]